MKYAHQYIKSAVLLLESYDGSVPLAAFLKNHFSQHKKFGSKDRKYIAQLCYNYFRLGHAAKKLSREEGIRVAVFLTSDTVEEWIELFPENWISNWSAELNDRISFIATVHPAFDINQLFPFQDLLSNEIDATAFSVSHLTQPDLFIRVRPGRFQKVIGKLTAAKLIFHQLSETTLSLPNGTKLEDVLEIEKDVVIQDYSSQKVGELFNAISEKITTVWDCCAASGGKSILAKDLLGEQLQVTVSDLRASILHNLNLRFQRAGMVGYKTYVADLSDNFRATVAGLKDATFDLVIFDAPCSGSGTWSRSPEQLYYFKKPKLEPFLQLQQQIVKNILPSVKKEGYLLYITCSVFAGENEAMAAFIQANPGFTLIKQHLIKGYAEKADTMFAALFRKTA